MFDLGLLLNYLAWVCVTLLVAYFVIRRAVRDGILDAQKKPGDSKK